MPHKKVNGRGEDQWARSLDAAGEPRLDASGDPGGEAATGALLTGRTNGKPPGAGHRPRRFLYPAAMPLTDQASFLPPSAAHFSSMSVVTALGRSRAYPRPRSQGRLHRTPKARPMPKSTV